MRDPIRMLDDQGASRSAVDLLRAIDPPKAAPAAVRAALGKQLGNMVAHSGAHAAAGIAWAKIVMLSVAIGGAGTVAVVWKLSGGSATQAASPRVPHVGAASPELPSPPGVVGENPSELPSAPAAATSARPGERARTANAPGGATAEPRDRLAEEEAILEEARKALSQDPSRALTLLRRHQSRFANGELTAERMYLSVDCLSRLGKREAAKREADALIERYPSSAYARRAPLLLTSPH